MSIDIRHIILIIIHKLPKFCGWCLISLCHHDEDVTNLFVNINKFDFYNSTIAKGLNFIQ